MKWEKLKPPEPDDPMCCCECDIYQYGCCCDCEDLDEAFNRWLRHKPPHGGCHSLVLGALIDNLEISMIPALMLLPLLLRAAALHYLLGIIILTALPSLVLWYYYATHRKRRRTLFFLTLALFSLAYMYYLFITEILPRGDISHLQLCTVTAGMILTIGSLIHTKRGPGFHSTSYHSQSEEKGGADALCAKQCDPRELVTVEPVDPASSVWTTTVSGGINSCVGQANHRSFLLTLLVFLLTSLYGISLVLCSICPGQYVMTALFYCPGVYSQSSSALCFTCAWYSSIVTAGLLYLLVVQVLNISFNVTEREAQLALRNKTGQSRLWGLVIHTGEYSRGFCQNWVEFLTMTDASVSPRSSLPDLV
ncbi:unnamed protein product [Pleuronectes platessa]|uniref:Palmitoyltransferase n=1 Tax=Pleuronectes platessa TaxID=8262 RepID=A0A9N7U015_PLEPL|nr:unnamed protein product [Pleuronectes platessa]